MLLAYRLLMCALSLPMRVLLFLLAVSHACRNFRVRGKGDASSLIPSRLSSNPSPWRRARELCGIATQPRPRKVPLLWLHGVDIGEARIALMLAQEFWQKRPHLATLITTTSQPAANLVAKQCDKRLQHQFAPLDKHTWWRNFLKHWQPTLAIRCENEFWPNSIIETARHCPLLFVQARMSEKSFRRWQKISMFSQFSSKVLGKTSSEANNRASNRTGNKANKKLGKKPGKKTCYKIVSKGIGEQVMGSVSLALCQDEDSSHYLSRLGVARTQVLGNLKSLAVVRTTTEQEDQHFAGLFRNESLWIAASTHAEEEKTVIEAHLHLLKLLPRTLCVIAPRDLRRVASICRLIRKLAKGFDSPLQLRSHNQTRITSSFYILNSFGELNSLYRWAPVVFVGGSLANKGGHNFFEPAQHNCKILHGPHLQNTHAELLHKFQLTQVVENAKDLSKHLQAALEKKGNASNAQPIIEQHNKTMRKDMLEYLEPYLKRLDKVC